MEKKMKRFNNIMYPLLIISIFLKVRIYPLIMLVLIFVNSFIFIKNLKLRKYQIIILLFLIYNTILYLFSKKYIMTNQNFSKLIISFTYLLFFEYSFKKYSSRDFKTFFYKINKTIEYLLVFNFIQIISLYFVKKISLLKLFFLKTSSDAYIINFNDIYMFLGNENKNIWSTKIGIILIIYIFSQKYILKIPLKRKIIYIGTLSIFLVLSRTGILFIILFYLLIFWERIRRLNKKIRSFIFLNLIIPFYFILQKIYFKIFRINFSNMNDGGLTRLFNWNLFRQNYFKENYIFGIGLGGTSEFLKKHNSILIDGHMHNVIINLLLEIGLIGGGLYIILMLCIILNLKKILKEKFLLLTIPFMVVLFLQYMGYDNDVVIYFSFTLLINYSLKKEKDESNISYSNNKQI